MSQETKKQPKQFDDYDGGNGPRPPVPGEESKMSKMTTEGGGAAVATTVAATASSLSNTVAATNRSPPSKPPAESFAIRVSRWQQSWEYLLADAEGIESFRKFVKRDGGDDSKHSQLLNFYFACEGYKIFFRDDVQRARKTISLINKNFFQTNIIEAPSELLDAIKQKKFELHMFDELQTEVEQFIVREIYPAFLTSDYFIEEIQKLENEEKAAAAAATATPEEIVNVTDSPHLPVSSSSSCSVASGGSYSSSSTAVAMHSMVASIPDGGAEGGATAAESTPFSRIGVDVITPFINTSNLQTLHEDAELKLNAKSHSMKPRTVRPMPKLTEDLLLATQKGRLEVRPQGAHGYTYSVPFNSSYNPVSRQDSERQSCSSAGQTSDSEVNSKDGKPYMHRKPTAAEDYRKAHINPQVSSQKTLIKPLNQGLKESVEPISKSKMEIASYPIDYKLLCKKLEYVKREQDKELEKEHFIRSLSNKLNTAAQPRVIANDVHQEKEHLIRSLSNILNAAQPRGDVDVQSILDHHVSSVFSPRHTPGTTSPKNLQRSHHRSNEMSSSVPDFAMPPIRHSRSIPENASYGLSTSMQQQQPPRRPTHIAALYRCPSQNIDSGISLYSADIPYNKSKEMKPIDQFSDESMRRSSKDDSRRSRKQLPLPQQQLSSMSQSLLCQQSLSSIPASTSSNHHTNSLTRPELTDPQDYTYAHYHFADEKIPYRIKIPGKKITLKMFKDHAPRKGNYRYFFQTKCDENLIVQEEVVNDSDVVPIHDDKVIASVK